MAAAGSAADLRRRSRHSLGASRCDLNEVQISAVHRRLNASRKHDDAAGSFMAGEADSAWMTSVESPVNRI